ncbi:hypothetical protein ACQ27_gp415 [Klebsiella phage K64-1]|nr:hypothetical protein ACQ27_gp415 [Klebsiella phage K64-1]
MKHWTINFMVVLLSVIHRGVVLEFYGK